MILCSRPRLQGQRSLPPRLMFPNRNTAQPTELTVPGMSTSLEFPIRITDLEDVIVHEKQWKRIQYPGRPGFLRHGLCAEPHMAWRRSLASREHRGQGDRPALRWPCGDRNENRRNLCEQCGQEQLGG